MSKSDSKRDYIEGKAYHEAGHALLDHLYGHTLTRVSIKEENGRGGVTEAMGRHPFILSQEGAYDREAPEGDAHLCHLVMIILAGEIAQRKFRPESILPHQDSLDLIAAEKIVRQRSRYIEPVGVEAQMDELKEFTRNVLDNTLCSAAVAALAHSLMERETITGPEAQSIMSKAINRARQDLYTTGNTSARITCPHCIEYKRRRDETGCYDDETE